MSYIKLDPTLVDGVARGESALLVVRALAQPAEDLRATSPRAVTQP